jgi:hypothetical protein
LVQDRRRPNDRVSGEGQFVEQIEDPGTNSARLIRRLKINGFEMPHLLGDAQHLFRTQVPSVGKDRQAVAAEWGLAEDVDMTVSEIHQILVTALT